LKKSFFSEKALAITVSAAIIFNSSSFFVSFFNLKLARVNYDRNSNSESDQIKRCGSGALGESELYSESVRGLPRVGIFRAESESPRPFEA
jgi:hypothetical protein